MRFEGRPEADPCVNHCAHAHPEVLVAANKTQPHVLFFGCKAARYGLRDSLSGRCCRVGEVMQGPRDQLNPPCSTGPQLFLGGGVGQTPPPATDILNDDRL
jgi:hypothetical protein